jgi:hypothetical protein
MLPYRLSIVNRFAGPGRLNLRAPFESIRADSDCFRLRRPRKARLCPGDARMGLKEGGKRLFVAQGDHWIGGGRTARGDIAR